MGGHLARPRLSLLAGLPGAGKSSLLLPHLVRTVPAFAHVPRFDAHQAREELQIPSADAADLDRLVARSVPAALRSALARGTDWVHETDLRSDQELAAIGVAVRLGYVIEMAFVGVADPSVLAARVSSQDPRRDWSPQAWPVPGASRSPGCSR